MDDRAWVAAAVGRFERPLLAYVRGLLNDRHRGRDVVQEAFLELCRASRSEVEPKLAPWLFTVCRRRVLDILRKEQRMTSLTVEPPGKHAGPAEQFETQDAAAAVLARLAELPAGQQEAVRLRFLQSFSYREIAGVMGLTESHVGVLLHTAIKTLRQTCTPAAPEVSS